MMVLKAKGTNREVDSLQDAQATNLPVWSLVRLGRLDLITTAIAFHTPGLTAEEPCTNYTALHCAVIANRIDALRLLLVDGTISPELCGRDGQTALHLAVIYCNLAAVQLLLSNNPGTSLNHRDRWGLTPLSIAHTNASADSSAFDIAITLIEAGAMIDVEKLDLQKLLLAAVELDSVRAVQQLIKAGADVLAQDEHGRTALQIAKSTGNDVNAEMIRVLVTSNSFVYPMSRRSPGEEVVVDREARFVPFRSREVDLSGP